MSGSMYYFKLVNLKEFLGVLSYEMLNLSIDRPSAMSKAQKDVLADASNSTSSAADAATSTGATMSATAPMSGTHVQLK